MFRQRSEKHRFACIPASSAAKNEIRYKEFAAMVCRLTGAINAYDHIHVEGERLAVHEKFDQKKLQLVQVIEFDKEFSKARRCFASTTFSPKAFPMPALPFSWRNWEPKSWAASLSERRSSKCNHHPSLSPLCSRGLKIKSGPRHRARTVFPLLDISSSCQRPFPKLSSFTVTLLQNTPRSPTILRPTRSMASSSAFSSFLADTLSVSVSPNSVVTVTR